MQNYIISKVLATAFYIISLSGNFNIKYLKKHACKVLNLMHPYMYLQQLSVINFKNYAQAELVLSEGVNAFMGNNGAGKTNLLDAIHYLSLCKSYFNPIDSQQIKQGADFFIVTGTFNRDD